MEKLLNKVLEGGELTFDEAIALSEKVDTETLAKVADEVRQRYCNDVVDTCSIINARSGKCSENCKWCAQSAHFKTGVQEYAVVPEEEMMEMARYNDKRGVHRFSLVTSGRKVNAKDLKTYCHYYRRLNEETNLYLCASMGLMEEDELRQLYEAGVKRYHCNLEAAQSYFGTLCTTHTSEDKKRTIRAAQRVGMQICSGGIIGMGETMHQRIELAFELRELGVDSVPVNILNPIKGTPLQDVPYISDDEIRRTVALFRLILPKTQIRFAGGRLRLPKDVQKQILRGGMNGSLVGDMLTTVGNRINDDKTLFDETGYKHTLK